MRHFSDVPPNIGLQRTSACGLAAEAGSFGLRRIDEAF